MATVVVPPSGLLRRSDSDIVGGLVVQPEGINFATQDSDEEVFVILRRAVITNFGWVSAVAFYASLPIALLVLLTVFELNVRDNFPDGYLWVLPLLYYSALLTYAIVKFNEWFYNLIIVTNKRLLFYSFSPLTTYRVSETYLENIQDVSQSTVGFFPSIFNYGDLLVQTASQRAKFVIKNIPRPTWVRNILVDLASLAEEQRSNNL